MAVKIISMSIRNSNYDNDNNNERNKLCNYDVSHS